MPVVTTPVPVLLPITVTVYVSDSAGEPGDELTLRSCVGRVPSGRNWPWPSAFSAPTWKSWPSGLAGRLPGS